MRLPRECYQMQKAIETHLPHLSQPQLTGLVLWVCGAILADSACQNAVASALSPWSNWHKMMAAATGSTCAICIVPSSSIKPHLLLCNPPSDDPRKSGMRQCHYHANYPMTR